MQTTSASVACGFHAGDPLMITATCRIARDRRLATTGKLEAVDGTLLRPEGDSVVYLISDLILPSLFAADYKVLEVLDHVVGTLRCWVEATGSGAWRSNAELSMWIWLCCVAAWDPRATPAPPVPDPERSGSQGRHC